MLNVGPFTPAEVEIGFKTELGLETRIYFVPEVCSKLGSFRASGATTGAYASAGGPQIPAGGREVVAVISSPNGAVGIGEMSLTFDVVLEDDEVDTATASWGVPSYSQIQDNVWGFGVGRDLLPDTPLNEGKAIKSITGLDSSANLATGIIMDLYSVPALSSYSFIGNTTDKELPSDIPTQVAIADGYDAAAEVKPGRGEIGQAAISYRYKGITEQLSRFNGVPGTLMAEIMKEDVTLWQRCLYSGFRPASTATRGDGNAEVMAVARGIYRTFMEGYGLGA